MAVSGHRAMKQPLLFHLMTNSGWPNPIVYSVL